MSYRGCLCLASVGILTLMSGCVERRFVIDSNPPGTKVYVNNRPVGFTPVDVPFVYYGTYLITLERDGYQTKTIEQRVAAPWYAYPPLDFLTENIYPGKASDIRRLDYEMTPLARPNLDELRYQAEELRERGRNLPEPTIPVEPRTQRPAPAPVRPPVDPRPPVQPLPTILPPASPYAVEPILPKP
ncbi:MAG: PEGA domain-containing protein [Planctomycetes bacterium]|nr:PEGA domain-containing protein [Planctomycetota bacterium]